jgi:AhpD family alkylhydroperoxidase
MEQLRRFASVPLASRYYREALEHMGDMRRAYRSGILDKRFIERIMLAVTQVNGCKMCSYAHTRMALESGMSAQEIRCMLSGEFADVPDSQQKAILYAEHYAQTEGNPSPESTAVLLESYGRDQAVAILAFIRIIMLGNAYGNSLGALQERLKGTPAPGSTLSGELLLLSSIIPVTLLLLIWQLVRVVFPPYRRPKDRLLDT